MHLKHYQPPAYVLDAVWQALAAAKLLQKTKCLIKLIISEY